MIDSGVFFPSLSPADAFVNSQEWTLSRTVPELKVVSLSFIYCLEEGWTDTKNLKARQFFGNKSVECLCSSVKSRYFGFSLFQEVQIYFSISLMLTDPSFPGHCG